MAATKPSWLERFAEFLIRRRFVLMGAALVAMAMSVVPASRLRLERTLESLYAPDNPRLQDYLESKANFGGDEFIVVAYTDPELLSPEGLVRVRQFADALSAVPGVSAASTQHLADAITPRKGSFLLRLLLRVKRPQMLDRIRGVLIGADNATTAVVLRLEPLQDASQSRSATFERIRTLAESHHPPASVVGEPVLIHDMFRYVEEDGRLLFYVSLVLLGGVLLVLFRSPRWVVLSLLVVAASVLWTEALLAVSGLRLSMVSSMLNSLLTIIGVQTATHLIVHYRDLRTECEGREAFRRAIVELSPAIFWIVVTTAAGFGALLTSEVSPANSFGLMMSVGTMMVLVALPMILPCGADFREGSERPRTTWGEARLAQLLERATLFVDRHPGRVIGVTAVVFAVAIAGFFRLKIETDFSKNFRASSPIVQALDFVETRLGGAGTWEVNFPAPEELTPEYLDRVRELAAKLRNIGAEGGPRLTKVVAITDILDLVPRVPFSSANSIRDKLDRIAEFQPEYEKSLYNADTGRMRLILRARERQPSEEKVQLIETVDCIARSEFEGAKTTGLFVLMTYLIETLLRDQIVSLTFASLGVMVMMAAAFGSLVRWRPHGLRQQGRLGKAAAWLAGGLWIGVLSLIPSLLPIALVVGSMGWGGMPINIGTAMIASVSIGFTIDFTIHYLTGFQQSQVAGLDFESALRETSRGAGRALVFATLALIAGFSVLMLSHFIPMVHFGLLVSVAMVGGLIANLLQLPLILRWCGAAQASGPAVEASER